MTKQNTINSLGTLVRLRSTEVERLQADLAKQERCARATRPPSIASRT
jgi:hypothetical protein